MNLAKYNNWTIDDKSLHALMTLFNITIQIYIRCNLLGSKQVTGNWDGWENEDTIVPTLLVPSCTIKIKGCVDFSRRFTKCVIIQFTNSCPPVVL